MEQSKKAWSRGRLDQAVDYLAVSVTVHADGTVRVYRTTLDRQTRRVVPHHLYDTLALEELAGSALSELVSAVTYLTSLEEAGEALP